MRSKWWGIVFGVAVAWTLPQAWAQVSVDPVEIEPIPQPEVVRRVVASPRVSVAPNPAHPQVSADLASRCCRTIGAAYNFPRPHGRLLVGLGTTVFVQLGNDIEGVWYDGACGWLGAYIGLDVFDDNANRFVGVGRQYRAAPACGPAWGSVNNMGVRFLPERPGVYLLRARVISFALPLGRDLKGDYSRYGCRDLEQNYIFTLVRVIDRSPTPEDENWLRADVAVEGVEPIEEALPIELVDVLN